MITVKQLMACTGASEANATRWCPFLVAAMQRYNITKPVHVAAFLAQVGVESGCLSRIEEGLTYTTPERLMAVWPVRFPTRAAALPYVRNPVALANKVYGGRMGNGPDEGYKYRGRGLKQLTGKDNYKAYAKASGLDVVNNPDMLLQPQHAADSAAWFWATNGCAKLADARDWKKLTKVVNGGLTGYQERLALTNAGLAVLV